MVGAKQCLVKERCARRDAEAKKHAVSTHSIVYAVGVRAIQAVERAHATPLLGPTPR